MVGVILKSMEAYSAFMTFRKEWYVPTKFIIDSQDIDSSVDLIISDMPLSVKSSRVLMYGKDIRSFYDLSKYVSVTKAIPVGTQRIVDTNRLKSILPDITIEDSLFEDLYSDFADLIYDSREMSGLEFNTDGMDEEAIEREKNRRIASILAERAAEKAREEQARIMEENRLKEEAEKQRIAEALRLEKERQDKLNEEAARRERELQEAKNKAEFEKAELEHKQKLLELELEAEKSRKALELEAKRLELLQKKESDSMEQEIYRIDMELNEEKPTIAPTLKKSNPTIISRPLIIPDIANRFFSNFLGSAGAGGLRIGRRSSSKKASIFLFAGAQKECGSSTIAYNFAHTLAGISPNTVLVDLDFIDCDLTARFNSEGVEDCHTDSFMTNNKFDSYISGIDNHTLKINIGKRRISFISCNSINNYSADNKRIIRDYDFSKFLMALTSRYDNVIVDIGCVAQIEAYQSKLLKNDMFRTFVCYNAQNSEELNECAQNVYNVRGSYGIILSKASDKIKRLYVEKKLRRQVIGVIPYNARYFDNETVIYSDADNVKLKEEWKQFVRSGGVAS